MEPEKRTSTLTVLEEQEKRLTFSGFSAKEAWEIGCLIREKIVSRGCSGAIDITYGNLCLFSCCIDGAAPHNHTWLLRKRNTVLEFWQSSYYVTLKLEEKGKTLEERGVKSLDCALSGGGFPIRLENGLVVGTFAVSGMDQAMDHQMIVDAVAEYLHVNVPSVFDCI